MPSQMFRPHADGRVYNVLSIGSFLPHDIWHIAEVAGVIPVRLQEEGVADAPIELLVLTPYGVAWEGGDKAQSDGREIVVRARIALREEGESNPVVGFCWDFLHKTGLLNIVPAP